jgi:hypothetical protein
VVRTTRKSRAVDGGAKKRAEGLAGGLPRCIRLAAELGDVGEVYESRGSEGETQATQGETRARMNSAQESRPKW